MFTRGRVAICVIGALTLVGSGLFAVHTRHDLHSTRDALTGSQHNLSTLDAQLHASVTRRGAALATLDRVRAVMRSDTAARDALSAANRAEYRRLTAALASLDAHRSELASTAARARLLDDCLIGASQVLNEAAVADTARLASTLPSAQRRCAEAGA